MSAFWRRRASLTPPWPPYVTTSTASNAAVFTVTWVPPFTRPPKKLTKWQQIVSYLKALYR